MTQDEIKEAATRLGCWAVPFALVGSTEAHNIALVALVQEAVKAEREACAKTCDALNFIDNGTPAGVRASNRHCAAAIRARGQQ